MEEIASPEEKVKFLIDHPEAIDQLKKARTKKDRTNK